MSPARHRHYIVKSAIARKLILYVVLFSSLVTLIITAVQLYSDYSKEIKSIEFELDKIDTVHAEALSASLWAVDINNLKTQLEGMLNLRDMEFLQIKEKEKVWATAGELTSENIIQREIPLQHVSKGVTRQLGTLRAVATLDAVYTRLIDKAIVILVSNAIKTFLVAGFMLFIFNYLVTRHLIKIAGFAHSINIDNPEPKELHLERREQRLLEEDELLTVVNSLNEMQRKVALSYRKLKASEEKYRQFVELAQEGIWTIDKDSNTSFVNPAMASMLGYKVEEMTGKNLFYFMDEQGKEIATSNVEKRKLGVSETHDFELIRKDGKRIYTTMAVAPILDNDGNYDGAIAGVIDITRRKMAEDNLRNHKDLLEDLVHQRTKALELSNQELEAFSYSVAHDLRTPLRSITSFSQILKEESGFKLSPEGNDALERIIRAGKNMSELIDELLELSRIARANVEYMPINISSMAEDILAHIAASNSGHPHRFDIQPSLQIEADPTLMYILLQNLINNAWKFSSNRETIFIEIGQTNIDGTQCFFVKDNGAGFNMNYSHKLFDAFQRLHGAEFSGNGIGLATVHRIIQRHGGKIWAESVEGEGAVFYFHIPRQSGSNSQENVIQSLRQSN